MAARCTRPPLDSGGEAGHLLARAPSRRYCRSTARPRLGAGMIEEPFERDFEAIEAAVMETPRGRWFLAEFAKRNRVAETRVLLDAVARLEQSLVGHAASSEAERLRAELARMAEVIDAAKHEAGGPEASSDPGRRPVRLPELLARLARNAETATADIHAATERVQETAWTLRERGTDPAICAEVDDRAAQIHTACAFQELTGQRTRRLVEALCLVEDRIEALTSPLGGAAPAPEAAPPPSSETFAPRPSAFALPPSPPERPQVEPPPIYRAAPEAPQRTPSPPAARRDPRRGGSAERTYPQTLAELDRLDIREKLKLFT